MSVSPMQLGLRERKKLAVRRSLQRSALRLATERGTEVTVEEICRPVDVSPRTFFNYFSSKEEALVGERPEPPSDEVLAPFEQGLPGGPLLLDLCDALAGHLRDRLPPLEEIHQRERLLAEHPHLLPHFVSGFSDVEQRIRCAVARRLGSDVEDMRAQATASAATALMRLAVSQWSRSGGVEPVDRYLRRAFDALLTA